MIEGSIERVKGYFLRGEALIESFCLCYWNMNSDGIIGSKFKESIVVFTPEIDKDSVQVRGAIAAFEHYPKCSPFAAQFPLSKSFPSCSSVK